MNYPAYACHRGLGMGVSQIRNTVPCWPIRQRIKVLGAQQSSSRRPPLSVAFILLPEFTLLAFSSFVEVLRLAADRLDGSRQISCRWTILGSNRSPIKSSSGVEVTPWDSISNNDDFDYIVVVGGLIRGHAHVDSAVLEYLKRADHNRRTIIALCTGTFILAAASLLNSHHASVHWVHEAEFKALYPDVPLSGGTLFSVSPRRITCSGGAAAADVAAYILSRHLGIGAARKAMAGLSLPAFRSGRDPQVHKPSTWLSRISDPLVRRAILIMGRTIGRHNSVARLCDNLGVSSSSLERAFRKSTGCAPARFNRMLRLAYAQWELLHSGKSITQIATDFGFTDSSHFIQLFHRNYGVTPMALRRRCKRDGRELPDRHSGETDTPPVIRCLLDGELLFFEEDQEWLDRQVTL
jgi:transcriptional regulator GlxA family with amidase domain